MKGAAELPHFGNADPFQNRTSAFATEERFLVAKESGLTVDQLHGHAWNYALNATDAVYGRSEDFAPGPLDSLANGAFLRVPYRRIPRIRIGSMSELSAFADAIVNPDRSISVMWRGQTALHTLATRRSAEELLKYYGATDVVEPSLLSSAARGGIDIQRYMDAWFGVLDVFIDELHAGLRSDVGAEHADEWELDTLAMRQSYVFREWAFGVAQHYGLPSTGLDLTPDLDVAAFFALHEFAIAPDGSTTITRVDRMAEPVVLLMAMQPGDLGIDKLTAPPHLITPRASAQKAHFFRTAWGAAPNRAAERIIAVLDLVDHAKWTIALTTETLFPSLALDPFARFLCEAQVRFPDLASVVPLQRVYFRI